MAEPHTTVDYSNPPLVETVLGVQFDRLPLTNAHLGAFWKTLDVSQWREVEDVPLLPNQIEQFETSGDWKRAIHFRLTQDLACRLQIRNAASDRMLQIQNTRLHLNWLKRPDQPYPRYAAVKREFELFVEQFKAFLDREHLGEFRPNQWEITYVNEIDQGTVWTSPADWGFFRPLNGIPTVEQVIEGESFAGEWHFVIPDQRGRLHIDWQHAKERADHSTKVGREFIRLIFTARGRIANLDAPGDAVLTGLDIGHKTIVHAFRSLMSDSANRYWGLQ